MSILVEVEDISKAYGDIVLFSQLSFTIRKGSKAALIAPNGTGKSSLLSILTQKHAPDSGEVRYLKGTKLAFLEQEPLFEEELTAFQNMLYEDSPLNHAVRAYQESLNSGDADQMQSSLAKMDSLHAWDYEAQINKLLAGLHISDTDQPVKSMSGGQRKRLALARILLSNADILVLDEPTNHLDLEVIEWLEAYLAKMKNTVFMVTHDRYFLDRVCSHIYELDHGALYEYAGNFSYFTEKRAERIELKAQEIEKAKNLLRKEQVWMSRMPKARATKAKYRIDNFHSLKKVASQQQSSQSLEMNFDAKRLGTKVLNLKNIAKSFDSKVLLKDFSYDFQPYEKLGIVGRNGVGKTTLLRILTGELPQDSGTVELGTTTKIGYYSQHGIRVDEKLTVLDCIKEIAESIQVNAKTTLTASEFLNYFLFPHKKQLTKIEKLSGGEKRRLYLLTVLMTNPNFLILDEPTNDLDIMTLGVLEDYLRGFQGTVLLISHDRFFMDSVVDQLLIFQGDGLVKPCPGNYSYYLETSPKPPTTKPATSSKPSTQETKKQSDHTKTDKPKISYQDKQDYANLQKEIDTLNTQLESIDTELSSGTLDTERIVALSKERDELVQQIDDKELRWLELSELIEG